MAMESFKWKLTYTITLLLMFFYTITISANEKNIYRIYYRSPYGCTHEVILDNNGRGVIKAGIADSFDKKDIRFTQLIKKENFVVSVEDFREIRKIVLDINNSVLKESNNDGFRYVLIVNKTKKLDVFGEVPEALNDISIILSKYYSFEIDWFCEEYISSSK